MILFRIFRLKNQLLFELSLFARVYNTYRNVEERSRRAQVFF